MVKLSNYSVEGISGHPTSVIVYSRQPVANSNVLGSRCWCANAKNKNDSIFFMLFVLKLDTQHHTTKYKPVIES